MSQHDPDIYWRARSLIAYSLQVLLFLLVFAGFHTFFADLRVKAAVQKHLGGSYRGYRLVYNLINLTASIWFILIFKDGDHVLYQFTGVAALLGHLAQAFGAGLMLYILVVCFDFSEFIGLRQLIRRETDNTPPPLKTDGPFAWCRHPLYLGGILLTAFNPRVSVLGLCVFAFVFFYALLGSIPEERKLVQDYGEPYEDYQAVTPRLLPRAGRRVEGV